jgi:hypothetical protein
MNLIDKAKNRIEIIGYSEKHHILPKCMGGTDESSNIVSLTAREHFIAHILLAKMDLSKKHHIQMLHAANAMANKYTQVPKKRQYNSHSYASLRVELKQHLSEMWKGDKNPIHKLTEEQREEWKQKLKEAQTKNMQNPIFYAAYKEKHNKAISTIENRKKISEKTKEAMARPEVREKYLLGFRNRVVDKVHHKNRTRESLMRPEVIEKMQKFRSIKRKWCNDGKNNRLIPINEPIPEGWKQGMYRTEENIKKLSENLSNRNKNKEPWNKGKVGMYSMSVENRKKMSESQRKRRSSNRIGRE